MGNGIINFSAINHQLSEMRIWSNHFFKSFQNCINQTGIVFQNHTELSNLVWSHLVLLFVKIFFYKFIQSFPTWVGPILALASLCSAAGTQNQTSRPTLSRNHSSSATTESCVLIMFNQIKLNQYSRVQLCIALWNKSNGSYDIKDFGSLPLIFSTSKYFRWKFQPCPSFFCMQIFQINEKGVSWAWSRWKRRGKWK